MNHKSLFFKFVIPSVIAFALSGVYAIVDGYFVGNTIGDVGLSAINIAYPIVAVLQALGTGIGMGMKGAAAATIMGQGVTAMIAILYALCNKKFYIHVELQNIKKLCHSIFRVGLAPFGLALTPNISLVLINRFSASYGGEKAIATYACVSYIPISYALYTLYCRAWEMEVSH